MIKHNTRIELSIRKPATRIGIRNAHQFAEATGLSLKPSYDLWNERSTRIDLTTLATLCHVLHCDAAEILVKRRRPKGAATT